MGSGVAILSRRGGRLPLVHPEEYLVSFRLSQRGLLFSGEGVLDLVVIARSII